MIRATDLSRVSLRLVSILLLAASAPLACRKQPVTPPPAGPHESGIASWYGVPFNGRQTASGEIYDMEKLTAAHRTYAFGTVLHVTNQTNGKVIEVRINDRGPFVANRIIDLSHAAAADIAMPGVAPVDLQVISVPPGRAVENFTVQLGAFADKQDALALMQRMQSRFGEARILFRPGDHMWRVLIGVFPTIDAANALAAQMDPHDGPAFVVALDDQPS